MQPDDLIQYTDPSYRRLLTCQEEEQVNRAICRISPPTDMDGRKKLPGILILICLTILIYFKLFFGQSLNR